MIMEQNDFAKLIEERRIKAKADIKNRIKKQWLMSGVLFGIGVGAAGASAYPFMIGNYPIGGAMLAVGLLTSVSVVVIHFRALKMYNKALKDLEKIGE